MSRLVRPRKEDSDSGDDDSHQDLSDQHDSLGVTDTDEDGHDSNASDGSMSDEYDDEDEDEPSATEAASLREISFGALAEAQAQVQVQSNPRKRKANYDEDEDDNNDDDSDDKTTKHTPDSKRKEPKASLPSRSSKHAPAVLSSKAQVSRARTIFAPSPALKARDPRFDAAVQQHSYSPSSRSVDKNYSFLTDYQAAEILELRAQIKAATKGGDHGKVAELKRTVMSMEARIRNTQTREREAEILAEHKRQERAALAEGRKSRPYYLKESEVRHKIAEERREKMGKRARDKADRRRAKRDKTKAAREMPRVRRTE